MACLRRLAYMLQAVAPVKLGELWNAGYTRGYQRWPACVYADAGVLQHGRLHKQLQATIAMPCPNTHPML
jgi:hypothetical protein